MRSFLHFGYLLQFSDSLNHFFFDLILQLRLVQVLYALEVLLPFVDFGYDLVEEVVQLALHVPLAFFLLLLFLSQQSLTRG